MYNYLCFKYEFTLSYPISKVILFYIYYQFLYFYFHFYLVTIERMKNRQLQNIQPIKTYFAEKKNSQNNFQDNLFLHKMNQRKVSLFFSAMKTKLRHMKYWCERVISDTQVMVLNHYLTRYILKYKFTKEWCMHEHYGNK